MMNITLISIFAGIGGMFGWGTSDFLASKFSEKIGHTRTLFYSQIAGLLLVAMLVFLRASHFTFTPLLLLLTIFSGIAYALGYLMFYKAFEIGNVSVISSVVNVQNVFVIAVAFFFFHQRISGIQIPALILLLVGVTLVSINFADVKKRIITLMIGVKECLLAAVLFGVFFWPFNQYVLLRADFLTVNLISKFVAIVTVFGVSLMTKKNLQLPKSERSFKALAPIVAVGILEAIGVLSVSGGLSVGNAIIINPISSALTVVTVGLAMIFLKEKVSKTQGLGILITVMGIFMMGLNG